MDLKIGESKMEIEVSKKESFIRQILKREWEFFQNVMKSWKVIWKT